MDQTKLCLRHSLGTSSVEHQPPQTFENEMTGEEIEQLTGSILHMHSHKLSTAEIYKALQTPTKRLGQKGKEKVSI